MENTLLNKVTIFYKPSFRASNQDLRIQVLLKTFLQANWKLNIPSKVKNLVGEHVVILYLGK